MKLYSGWSELFRAPRYVGDLPSQDMTDGSWQVERLVKSDRCGRVVAGDEIAAVTYAVDKVARGFSVLGELP
jgi:hypothetical protein